MDQCHLRELRDLEEHYWWHVARRQLIMALLQKYCPPPGRLVEGGFGSGGNLLTCQQVGYEVTGFDILEDSVRYGRQRGLADLHQHDLCEPWPIEADSVRAVLLLDVLEHVPHPVKVLAQAAAVLERQGQIILSVPAYPWLYGTWDRQLGHYRRYTCGRLRQEATRAGLRVQWLGHWNAMSLPAAVVLRPLSRLLPTRDTPRFPRVGPWINRSLQTCGTLERWWLLHVGIPCGLSLVGVLGK